jgi:predicted HicB family RNase H-like nuclease
MTKLEINMFTEKFIESARAVGFTDDQINFLAENFEFKAEDYD